MAGPPIQSEGITGFDDRQSKHQSRLVSCLRRYLSVPEKLLMEGTLAKRIAMYKMGAGFLSVSGIVLAPLVIATAEVPMMALPGPPPPIEPFRGCTNCAKVALVTFLPLLGYHYLTRKYVLSMHVYIPPTARTDLRTWTTYVNTLPRGTILRLRTFRLVIGIKSHIVPLDELQAVKIEGSIPAFEKNVEWVSTDWQSRTKIFGRKAWFLQHGYGGQEMDVFWRRVGMEESDIKEAREKAVEKMKDYIDKRQKGLKKVLDVIAPDTTEGKKGVKVEKKREKGEKKDKGVKKKLITLD
jgi:hypothetical protein